VPEYFDCPHLGGRVKLTDERRRHIERDHAPTAREVLAHLASTISDPDEVLVERSDPSTRAFKRRAGVDSDHVVVAIMVSDRESRRDWIVTAWATRRPPKGGLRWIVER
jgi:hypothetical protein